MKEVFLDLLAMISLSIPVFYVGWIYVKLSALEERFNSLYYVGYHDGRDAVVAWMKEILEDEQYDIERIRILFAHVEKGRARSAKSRRTHHDLLHGRSGRNDNRG